jgi:DNA-binding NarL/FixJ family response regulator
MAKAKLLLGGKTLTATECRVVAMMMKGQTPLSIAKELNLTEEIVDAHIRCACDAVGVSCPSALMAYILYAYFGPLEWTQIVCGLFGPDKA